MAWEYGASIEDILRDVVGLTEEELKAVMEEINEEDKR